MMAAVDANLGAAACGVCQGLMPASTTLAVADRALILLYRGADPIRASTPQRQHPWHQRGAGIRARILRTAPDRDFHHDGVRSQSAVLRWHQAKLTEA